MVRVGLIGCGNNMRAHLRRLTALGEVELVGVAEPSAEQVGLAREQFPELEIVPHLASHEELLDLVAPDAVVISTPHTLHHRQVLDALDAGCHVLCEKPLACTSAEAREICARAESADRVVMVSYQRHQQSLYRWMRRQVQEGALGQLQFVAAQQFQSWYEGRAAGKGWRHLPFLSGGGQLNDSGSHLIDILLHVTGLEPARVSALQQNLGLEVDVNMALTVEFHGGAVGSIAVVGQAPGIGGKVYEDLTLTGDAGGLYYRSMGTEGDRPVLQFRRRGTTEADPGPFEMPPESDPDRAFVDVILGRAENEAPPGCGLRTILLSEAAWESARRGGAPVEVATAPVRDESR